jgi:hypothetical protein
MTVNDLIKQLSALSEKTKSKPIKTIKGNGTLCFPEIKFDLIDKNDVLNKTSANVKQIILQ